MHLLNRLCVLGISLSISICNAIAQSSGTISGTVSDVTGKAIPNAVVTVRNEAVGTPRFASTEFGRKVRGERFARRLLPGRSGRSEPPQGGETRHGKHRKRPDVLNVSELAQSITVEGSVSVAAEMAPMQSTLDARSAKSEISPEYIQNFASPVADYTELLNNAPGTFSVNPNGVGLGDSKTYFRGFKDGQYTMQTDGIPFSDTDSPTHHSWAFFPSQFIAGVDFDRSPGSAASIGSVANSESRETAMCVPGGSYAVMPKIAWMNKRCATASPLATQRT
jgi:iron complex outermembrane receptor protein